MSLLRQIAIVLFIIGLIGLIVPGIPGREFIGWSIVLAIIVFVADVLSANRTR